MWLLSSTYIAPVLSRAGVWFAAGLSYKLTVQFGANSQAIHVLGRGSKPARLHQGAAKSSARRDFRPTIRLSSPTRPFAHSLIRRHAVSPPLPSRRCVPFVRSSKCHSSALRLASVTTFPYSRLKEELGRKYSSQAGPQSIEINEHI